MGSWGSWGWLGWEVGRFCQGWMGSWRVSSGLGLESGKLGAFVFPYPVRQAFPTFQHLPIFVCHGGQRRRRGMASAGAASPCKAQLGAAHRHINTVAKRH